MTSSKSVSRRMSYYMLITDICVSSSFVMVVRSMLFMHLSFENERSPLHLVLESITYIHSAVSIQMYLEMNA